MASSSKKSMDVSKPGKTAADASARPVIVTHRPIVQDPMMKQETSVSELETDAKTSETNKSPTSSEKVIKPLNEKVVANPDEIEKAANAALAGKKKDEPVEDEASTEAPIDDTSEKDVKTDATEAGEDKVEKNETKTAEPEVAKTEDTPNKEVTNKDTTAVGSDSAEVDAVADQAADKRKDKDAADRENAKQEHIQKLIEDKKYYVKIGQVARRRNSRIAVVLLVLFLVVVGLYLAVDAKLIDVDVNVPVEIIKN